LIDHKQDNLIGIVEHDFGMRNAIEDFDVAIFIHESNASQMHHSLIQIQSWKQNDY
jgi:hypothetical protein